MSQPFQRTDAKRSLLRRQALTGLALTALLSGGCVATDPLDWIRNGFKVGPNYVQPDAPVADHWIHTGKPGVLNRQVDNWWLVFQDPKLNELIEKAYDQNLTLRIVGDRVMEARFQRAIAVGQLFPQTQQAIGQYSRVNLSHTTFNNPSLLAGPRVPPGTPIGNNYSDWTSGFNMSWELDFWGRYRRGVESANATLDASIENLNAAIVTLLADVATNYVDYRVAQERIKIARYNIQAQEEVVRKAEAQLEGGVLIRLDVDQLQTLLEQTRSTIPALQILQGQANDALCVLLGIPPEDLEAILGPGPELKADPPNFSPLPQLPAWVAVGMPADLLRRRPDILSAERQVAAQSAQIGVAEADLYPTIYINGTLGYESAKLSQLFESRSFFGNITPNFKWNILNYGRIANNVRLQEAKTQELIDTYQNLVLTAAQQVETAVRGFLRSREQAEMLTRSAAHAFAATKLEKKIFEERKADVNREYTLWNTQLQEQDNLAVAQGNVALNLINVYRALGGGWEIRHEKEADAQELPPIDVVVPGKKL
jgi:NodT family efflux transporter outer membrane factor (OMF) lipoprotein